MTRGNPEVKGWMKRHKVEVEKVQAKYDAFKDAPVDSLLELAIEVDADLAKVKELLITKIIASESAR